MIELFPGLRSLRAFDAAATTLNFTRAAEVLGVTPAAISHQIKELEAVVGVPLFTRTSRSMTLTRRGNPPYGRPREPRSPEPGPHSYKKA